ncbi:MAG: hypothetical protein WCK11_03670 [Candidatus Falkowbacteria bacterium]
MQNQQRRYFLLVLIFCMFGLISGFTALATTGTIDSVYKYAWGENTGWINFGNSYGNVQVGDESLTGYAWSNNFGWINLHPTLAGVTNNLDGQLGGYAWGENLGWIDFTGVTIASSGEFFGYATISSTNSHINFNCSNNNACSSSDYRVKTSWQPLVMFLGVDIINASSTPVDNPAFTINNAPAKFNCQAATGTLGVVNQKIRITNTTINPAWTLTLAAVSTSSLWTSASSTFDFNDPTSAGCSDGADQDTVAGQLSISPTNATLTPKNTCDSAGISLGNSSNFSQGFVDNITLVTATGAGTNCYWDITGISMSQKVPLEQQSGLYNLAMTLTIVAN